MAIAFTAVGSPRVRIEGAQRRTVTDVTLDSSYPTGGYAVTPDQLGFGCFLEEGGQSKVKTAAGGVTEAVLVPQAAGGAKLVCNAGGAEVVNAANLTGCVVRVQAYGK